VEKWAEKAEFWENQVLKQIVFDNLKNNISWSWYTGTRCTDVHRKKFKISRDFVAILIQQLQLQPS